MVCCVRDRVDGSCLRDVAAHFAELLLRVVSGFYPTHSCCYVVCSASQLIAHDSCDAPESAGIFSPGAS